MASATDGTILGHPKGLYVLFFTEMWERFSFYGMKTLLVLYMINHFFWSQEDASSLLGTYAALAYGVPVIGDRRMPVLGHAITPLVVEDLGVGAHRRRGPRRKLPRGAAAATPIRTGPRWRLMGPIRQARGTRGWRLRWRR